MHPRVVLLPKRARPFYGRHPWVYAGAIAAVEGEPADGDVVDLVSHAGNFVARGLYNSRSKIRVRLYTWDPAVQLDDAFFRDGCRPQSACAACSAWTRPAARAGSSSARATAYPASPWIATTAGWWCSSRRWAWPGGASG